jgi:hypothetical protein
MGLSSTIRTLIGGTPPLKAPGCTACGSVGFFLVRLGRAPGRGDCVRRGGVAVRAMGSGPGEVGSGGAAGGWPG